VKIAEVSRINGSELTIFILAPCLKQLLIQVASSRSAQGTGGSPDTESLITCPHLARQVDLLLDIIALADGSWDAFGPVW
jgi:hypothetical protein